MLAFPLKAMAIFEFDGMPIDISEFDFIKERPSAKLLTEYNNKGKSKGYLYLPSNVMMFEGGKVIALGRQFEYGKGCGFGMGIQANSSEERNQLVERLKKPYTLVQDSRSLGSTHQIIYLENDELYASIGLPNSRKKEIAYTLTSKSCGEEVARRWQTLPRK